jgi:hypothetical protein
MTAEDVPHTANVAAKARIVARITCGLTAHCIAAATPYVRIRRACQQLVALDRNGTRLMTTFDKRKEGFEKQFAFEQERKFRADARRNRLLGLWAAEKLGFTGDAALAYARDVVAADFEEAGDADVVRKVLADLRAKDAAITEQAIRDKMNELAAQALAEVKAEGLRGLGTPGKDGFRRAE